MANYSFSCIKWCPLKASFCITIDFESMLIRTNTLKNEWQVTRVCVSVCIYIFWMVNHSYSCIKWCLLRASFCYSYWCWICCYFLLVITHRLVKLVDFIFPSGRKLRASFCYCYWFWICCYFLLVITYMFVKFVDFNLPSGSTLRASFITIDFEYAVALLLLLPIGLLNWLISSFHSCCKFPPLWVGSLWCQASKL